MIYDNWCLRDLILLNRLLIFMKSPNFRKSLVIIGAILAGSLSILVLGAHTTESALAMN
jgi:hypothetical protein